MFVLKDRSRFKRAFYREQFYVITVLKKYGSFLCVSRFLPIVLTFTLRRKTWNNIISSEVRGSAHQRRCTTCAIRVCLACRQAPASHRLPLAGLFCWFHGSLGPCHSDFETVSYWVNVRPIRSSRVSQFGCRSVSKKDNRGILPREFLRDDRVAAYNLTNGHVLKHRRVAWDILHLVARE